MGFCNLLVGLYITFINGILVLLVQHSERKEQREKGRSAGEVRDKDVNMVTQHCRRKEESKRARRQHDSFF